MKSPVRAAAAAAAITGDGRTGRGWAARGSRNITSRHNPRSQSVRPGLAGVLLPFPW